MLNSSFYGCGDAYILAKETIAITGLGADAVTRQANKRNKQVTFENWVPYTDCISKIITQVDYGNHLDVVILMCDLIE